MYEKEFWWQPWHNFMKMPAYLAAMGTDRYKELLMMTALPAVNAMAELAAKTEKNFKNEGACFVEFTTPWVGEKPGGEYFPITDEEMKAKFTRVGTTLEDKGIYLREGKLYVIKDRREITNPAGYYSAANASFTLKMMSYGLACLANTLMSTSNMLWKIYGQEPKKP